MMFQELNDDGTVRETRVMNNDGSSNVYARGTYGHMPGPNAQLMRVDPPVTEAEGNFYIQQILAHTRASNEKNAAKKSMEKDDMTAAKGTLFTVMLLWVTY